MAKGTEAWIGGLRFAEINDQAFVLVNTVNWGGN